MSSTKTTPETRSSVVIKEEESVAIQVSISSPDLSTRGTGLSWRHPSDLPYPDASDWTTDSVMQYIVTHSFSVPGRNITGKRSYFSTVTSADGTTTIIPSVYRIPLMFVANFLWRSVRLVLQAGEWEEFKLGILYVARVAEVFLGEARNEAGEKGIGKMWRSEMFNRLLVRYKLGWMQSDPAQVKEFWERHGDREYRSETVKTLEWTRFAVRGHRGFHVTEEQIEDGVTLDEFMSGLKEDDGNWLWNPPGQNNPGTTALEILSQWRSSNVWRVGKAPTTGPSSTLPAKSDLPRARLPSPVTPIEIQIPPAPIPVTIPSFTAPPSHLSKSFYRHPTHTAILPTVPISAPTSHSHSLVSGASNNHQKSHSYATPKSGIPFVFEALHHREQHILTLEKQLASLKRRLEYDEIYRSGTSMEGAEDELGTGFWRSSLSHLISAPEKEQRLTRMDSTPVKSRRKQSANAMDTSP